MSDLKRYIAEQCAKDPEFRQAYDEGKALEARARKIETILREQGHKRLKWYTILSVLEADRELAGE